MMTDFVGLPPAPERAWRDAKNARGRFLVEAE